MITFEIELNEIEQLYNDLLESLRKMHTLPAERTAKNQTYAIKGICSIVRKLELIFENVKRIENPVTKPYIKRMEENSGQLKELYLSAGGLAEYEIRLHWWQYPSRGVCDELRRLRYGVAYCTYCYSSKPLFSFLEDVKLVQSLMIFPTELRADVRNRLSELGFADVLVCLDEIDGNFIVEHRKDCVDCCRKALMKTVEYIISSKGQRVTQSFEGNLSILVEIGMLDNVDKRDVISLFSFLTQKSQHELLESETKMTNEDTNYAIGLTYNKIRRLLDKLMELERTGQS